MSTIPVQQTAGKGRRLTTKEIVLTGMSAAVMAVISQISIPMPTGMPITIQVFGITLIGAILGWKLGFFAILSYILLGAAGLPIFAGFQGGPGVLLNITGGYIWSWPIMVLLCGVRPKSASRVTNSIIMIACAILGLAINETAGGLQWVALAGNMSVKAVFLYSMTAFIPKDTILTVLAVLIGGRIRKTLMRAGFLAA